VLQRRRKDQDLYADVERKFVSDSERAVTPHEQEALQPPATNPGAFLFVRAVVEKF
jgi:hypothetical protein